MKVCVYFYTAVIVIGFITDFFNFCFALMILSPTAIW